MRYVVASAFILSHGFALAADEADPKPTVIYNARKMEVGQLVKFAHPRPLRKTGYDGATWGKVGYEVAKIETDKEMIVRSRTELAKGVAPAAGIGVGADWQEDTFLFVVIGVDTSKLADDKPAPLKGLFKVTGTRKTDTGRTLLLAEYVRELDPLPANADRAKTCDRFFRSFTDLYAKLQAARKAKRITPELAAKIAEECVACKEELAYIELYRDEYETRQSDVNLALESKLMQAAVSLLAASKFPQPRQSDKDFVSAMQAANRAGKALLP